MLRSQGIEQFVIPIKGKRARNTTSTDSTLLKIFPVHFSMELGEEPLVYSGAKLFQELVYSYRDSLTAGIICAGWDRKKGGQVRLQCCSFCPLASNQEIHNSLTVRRKQSKKKTCFIST